MKTMRWAIVVAATALAAVIFLVIVWSQAAHLLSARSDASVLLGLALMGGALVFAALSVYLILRKTIHDLHEDRSPSPIEAKQRAALFPAADGETSEHIHENARSKQPHK